MKHLLLFILALLIVSCSGSDDNSSASHTSIINPPAWIQGQWVLENNADYGFKFTSDDLCLKSIGIFTCNKETIELYEDTNVITNVDENISDNEYSVEITIGSNTTAYEFHKISDSQIQCYTPIQAIYTKQ
ncbi:hypothetical protein FUA48_06040 [Flavobacterium alkalisoli]|uniref:Lipocalin family protein n=1 Tax=Flavobacterium alkalisoli TaxID=2602769 RepID=A0A5B9FQA0_9FLAO|nr:hypothetical protein [Flavobacterium alkalisoli]QEE49154.1 hypothetical protein FUA48_06040 [Flavobacterium alkalisoli]